jgi:multiple sugar transport system permease protein
MMRKLATYLLVLLMLVPFAWPLVLMTLGSFKPAEQLVRDPIGLVPDRWEWTNYRDVFTSLPFATYLRNSLILCLGTVLGTTLSCSLVAYSLTRVDWWGRRWVMLTVIMTMLLPWQITMIPRFVLISQVGLYDSLWSIILPSFLGDAFFIFLLRQFYLSIPEQLFDAGRLDGLGHWGLFTRILLPLSKPALTTVALFQFVETWNNFGGPLLFLSDPQKFPLAYGLERYVSSYGDQTHLLLAAAVLFSLPLVLIFFLAQRVFVEGISTSGIKG